MKTELQNILESVQGMKNATESEVKALKDSIMSIAEKSDLQDTELKQIRESVEAIEQKSGLNVYSNEDAKLKEVIAAQKKAFADILRTGRKSDGMLIGAEEDAIKELKGMTVGDYDTSTSAGAGVIEELNTDILVSMREQYKILDLVNYYTVTSIDHYRMVQKTWSGVAWDGENVDNQFDVDNTSGNNVLQSTPTFEKISASFGKLKVDNYVTNESLKDPAFDVEGFLLNDVSVQMSRAVADAMMNGTGANMPNGLYSHFDATESLKEDYLPATPTQERGKNYFGEIQIAEATWNGYTDLEKIAVLRRVILLLKSGYHPNSGWLMDRATWDLFASMTDNDGRFYLQPDLSGQTAGSLLGFPVWIEDHANTLGTVGAVGLLFGDFKKAFNMINYVGLSMLRNPYIVPGNVNYHWETRIGAMIGDSWALKGLRIIA